MGNLFSRIHAHVYSYMAKCIKMTQPGKLSNNFAIFFQYNELCDLLTYFSNTK